MNVTHHDHHKNLHTGMKGKEVHSSHWDGEERRGKAFHKRKYDESLQNLNLLQDTRRALRGSQSRRLSEYMIDVLSEAVDPVTWRKLLVEARRRVTLYFPER
jgi:hypothetical protein